MIVLVMFWNNNRDDIEGFKQNSRLGQHKDNESYSLPFGRDVGCDATAAEGVVSEEEVEEHTRYQCHIREINKN
jgi:hypothetical protein